MKHHTQQLAILLLALFTLTGCSSKMRSQAKQTENDAVSARTTEAETETAEMETDTEADAETETETETQPVEEAADESETIYDQLYQAVWNEEATCRVENASSDEVQDQLYLLMEASELFWLESCETTTYRQGDQTLYVDVTFRWRYDDIGEKRQAVDAVREQFCATVPEDSSDYEKAKLAHDYLVTHITYDRGSTGGQDVYAALVEGQCVCSGYANAYVVLLNDLGLTSGTVTGTADGGSHAWNWVVLDGETYYTDVTWDDQDTFDGNGAEQISYNWFNLTLADMANRHVPSEGETVPAADATDANYYTVENAWLWEYSAEGLTELLRPQAGNGTGVLTFRCKSEDCYTAAVEALFDREEIYDILRALGYDSNGIRYTWEDDLWILTVRCQL